MDEETKAIIETTANAAAEHAANRILLSLGIEVDDPLEMQSDMLFLRNFRKTMDRAQNKSILTLVGFIVVTVLAVIGIGLQTVLGMQIIK